MCMIKRLSRVARYWCMLLVISRLFFFKHSLEHSISAFCVTVFYNCFSLSFKHWTVKGGSREDLGRMPLWGMPKIINEKSTTYMKNRRKFIKNALLNCLLYFSVSGGGGGIWGFIQTPFFFSP